MLSQTLEYTCKRGTSNPPRYADGRCKECKRKKNRRQHLKDPAKHRHRSAIFYAANSEKYRGLARLQRQTRRGELNAYCAKRRAKKLRATPIWANNEKVRELYLIAKQKGQHVDHIIPLNNPSVMRAALGSQLQLLSPNENLKKSNHFNP